MFVGAIIGGLLAPVSIMLVKFLGFSLYSRVGLDAKLLEYYGDYTFDDILADDLLVTAFEYNSFSPRFFSKAFNKWDPDYDVMLREAVGGSSSAPLYFDPLQLDNTPFNITEQLIDGGIICNNPAFYAYLTATSFGNKAKHGNTRILSLGTGIAKEKSKSLTQESSYTSKAKTATLIFSFVMEIETQSAVSMLTTALGDNFVRMQVHTEAELDTFGDYWYG